jgi:hypothetical protein
MATIVLNRTGPDPFATWQEQIGRQRGARLSRGLRPFCAVFFRFRGPTMNGLIELARLRIDVLHDLQGASGPVIHRLARFRPGLVANGIMFGGASRRQLEKNLSMTPGGKWSGRRIAATDSSLLGDALVIDKFLERHSRYPNYPRRSQPRLPRVLVSLSVNHPTGSGPEFERYCRDTGWPVDLALTSVRRLHRGRWLFPIEFVLHHAQCFGGVYADMTTVSRRQVFRFERTEDLIGHDGACRFDFWTGCYWAGRR